MKKILAIVVALAGVLSLHAADKKPQDLLLIGKWLPADEKDVLLERQA